jgi:N-acetyl-anhydromuramyl-L-alanine amidase AmpD
MLILHYTGMESAEAALDWLTHEESKVSCHYLIDEEGRIAQMVAEEARAWHAGQSLWAGETDLNSCSIGIEIHNPRPRFRLSGFSRNANAGRRGALPRHPRAACDSA